MTTKRTERGATHRIITVGRPAAGQELLQVLSAELRLSRRKAKQLLDERSVLVNTRRVWMARHRLQAGDRIEVHGLEPRAARAPSVDILVRDRVFLVAAKPPGILTDGAHSLEARLRAELSESGLRAVHRLDRDTSGCVLFTLDPSVRDGLVASFRERAVLKVYHAVAMGTVPDRVQAIRKPVGGLPASSLVGLVDSNRTASHVKIRIETGRTHQIRKHLAAAGHPIAGDRTYAPPTVRNEALRRCPRQMLHASTLAFPHPVTGQPVRAECPLPADFKAMLKALRLR